MSEANTLQSVLLLLKNISSAVITTNTNFAQTVFLNQIRKVQYHVFSFCNRSITCVSYVR